MQPGLPRHLPDQFHLGAGQIHSGWSEPQVVDLRRHRHRGDPGSVTQAIVDRAGQPGLEHAQAGGGIALWVHVYDEHPPPEGGEVRAQVHCGRGLPDPALLVHNRDDPCHPGATSRGHPILATRAGSVKEEAAPVLAALARPRNAPVPRGLSPSLAPLQVGICLFYKMPWFRPPYKRPPESGARLGSGRWKAAIGCLSGD